MNNIIKNSSLKDIEFNIDKYIKLFLENGLLIFPKVNLNDEEHYQLMQLFGHELNWGYIAQSFPEDHSVTFEMIKQEVDPGYVEVINESGHDLFINWHLEHVERVRPQVAASWRMDKFTCSNEFGATGFIDASALYDRLKDEWKQFLNNSFVKNPSGLNIERPCVISHLNSGKKILRLHPYSNGEILCRVGLNEPSDSDMRLYQEITEWVFNQIVEKEQDAFWWNWSEGDLLLIDLSTTIHAVTGGFLPEERSFTRHWAYHLKEDYDLYNNPIYSKGGHDGQNTYY
jgi:alpha-ketoglutarate-dependent taurine dioxygenase